MTNLALAISLFCVALSLFNSRVASAIDCNSAFNFIACWNSAAISSPIPLTAPLTSSNAPEKSPVKNLTNALPTCNTLSRKTSIAADIPAKIWSNFSAPPFVDANALYRAVSARTTAAMTAPMGFNTNFINAAFIALAP